MRSGLMMVAVCASWGCATVAERPPQAPAQILADPDVPASSAPLEPVGNGAPTPPRDSATTSTASAPNAGDGTNDNPAPAGMPGPSSTAPSTDDDAGWEEGLASYYGDAFVGRRTASGERYRHKLETCAHRTAPMGSTLEVERRDTGVRVQCRVNDRGPFVDGRVIDVSRSLARKLGFLESGVVAVRVRVASE